MRRVVVLFGLMAMLLLAACDNQPVPTLIPTSTPPPPTATPTETPMPTQTPTQTPIPTATPIIPPVQAEDPTQQATVRVVHAAPNSPAMDFYIEGLRIANFITYEQLTAPGGIVAGTYRIAVVPAGGRPTDGALVSQIVNIEGQRDYVMVFGGSQNNPTLQIVPENLAPLLGDTSRLQFVHALPDAAAVTIERTPEQRGIGQTTAISEMLVEALLPQTTSRSIVLDSDRSTYTVRSGETEFGAFPLDLRSRDSAIVILTGSAGNLITIPILSIAPGLANVRVINAVTGTQAVSVALDDIAIADSLAYGEASSFQTIETGSYDIVITGDGLDLTEDEDILTEVLFADADEVITLVLYVGQSGRVVIAEERDVLDPTPVDETRVTIFSIWPQELLLNLAFTETSEGDVELEDDRYPIDAYRARTLTLPAATYQLVWRESVDAEPQNTYDDIAFNAGQSYFYVYDGDETPLIYNLNVGTQQAPLTGGSNVTESQSPVQLRFVNAIPGLLINYRLDSVDLFNRMTYGTGTNQVAIGPGEHFITAHRSDTGALIARTIRTFNSGEQFTVFAYGNVESNNFGLMLAADDAIQLDDGVFTMRLVNLSLEPTVFGLGLSTAVLRDPDAAPTPIPDPADPRDMRRTLPIGVTRLINTIPSLSASSPVNVFRNDGTYALRIIDDELSQLAATIPDARLETGNHYDVIVFQEAGLLRVQVLVLPYPTE